MISQGAVGYRSSLTHTVGILASGVPTNNLLPVINTGGNVTVGSSWTAGAGAWFGSPTSYGYQWNRDGVPIAGQTANSYTVVSADQGHTITVTVTATNAIGSGPPATSLGVSVPAAANTYVTAVLADTPLAYYRLGDTTTTAVNQIGGGTNGTYSGAYAQSAANLLPTQAGASTSFSGGQVTIPDNPGTEIGAAPFTIEVWLKAASFPSYAMVCDQTGRWYTIAIASPTQLYLSAGSAASATAVTFSSLTLAAGTTYHLVYVTSATTAITVYVNGVAVGLNIGLSARGAANSNTGCVIAGNPSGGGAAFAGQLQEFAIYNTALSAARVSAHYAAA